MKKLFILIAAAMLSTTTFAAYVTNSYTIEFNDGGSVLTQVTSTGAIKTYVTDESAGYIESFAPVSGTNTRCYLKSTWKGLSVGYGSYTGNLKVNLSEKGQEDAASVTVYGKGTICLKFYSNSSDTGTELEFDCESYDEGITVNFKTAEGSATTKNIKYFEVRSEEITYVKKIVVNYYRTALTLDEASTDGYTTNWSSSKKYDLTINRTLIANQWNTLCLPFSMTETEATAAKLGTIMKMTSIEDNTVNFSDATEIEAGEMYIVKPTEAVTSFTASGKTLSTPEAKVLGDSWSATSPMYKSSISQESGNTKYVLSNDNFYTVDQQNLEIKGYRWYITETTSSGGNAKRLTLGLPGFDDDETAIESIDSDQTAGSVGKRLENGKIIIVKNNKKYNVNGMEVK